MRPTPLLIASTLVLCGPKAWSQTLSKRTLLQNAAVSEPHKKQKDAPPPQFRQQEKVLQIEEDAPYFPTSRVDAFQTGVSDQILSFSNTLDQWLSSEQVDPSKNKSHIKLTSETIWEKHEGVNTEFKLRGRLSLPRTEKSLQLIIESGEDELKENLAGAISRNKDQDDNSSTSAALRYMFTRLEGWDFSLDGGLRITDRIDPFWKINADKKIETPYWAYKFASSVSWYESKQYKSDIQFLFDHEITETVLFRIYNGLEWAERTDRTDWYHNYNIVHRMAKKQSLTYQIGAQGDNRPSWGTRTYFVNIGLRVLIYKNWAYATLKPGYVFRDEDGFRARTQLLLKFETYFGQF